MPYTRTRLSGSRGEWADSSVVSLASSLVRLQETFTRDREDTDHNDSLRSIGGYLIYSVVEEGCNDDSDV